MPSAHVASETVSISCGVGELLMAEELVPTLAKKPPTNITCGSGEEPKKLTDVANGKVKNAWVFNYALSADLDSNG